MADTFSKAIGLLGRFGSPLGVSVGPLQALTPIKWSPFAAAMKAQDSIPGSGNRVLMRVGLAGSHEFPVDDSNLATGVQTRPDNVTWRTIGGPIRRRYTPGCQLAMRVLFLPSGMTQKNNAGVWTNDGAQGQIRLRVTWRNGSDVLGPISHEMDLPSSNLGNGNEPANAAGAWTSLQERLLEEIWPAGFHINNAVAENHSDWAPGSYASGSTRQHEVELILQIKGGTRLVEATVYEVPVRHSEEHDTTDPQSYHAFVIGNTAPAQPQTTVPQIEAADGATYEEHRFGTRRTIETADWQSQRLGPAVQEQTSWRSEYGPPFPSRQDPWTATTTTPTELVNGNTAYDPNRPAWVIAGAYALPRNLNEPGRIIAGGGRAVIPVRVHVLASVATGGGPTAFVRVQTSPREWVVVNIAAVASLAHYTAVGFLDAQVHPDQSATALCQIFGSVLTTPQTLNVYHVAIDFGAW